MALGNFKLLEIGRKEKSAIWRIIDLGYALTKLISNTNLHVSFQAE